MPTLRLFIAALALIAASACGSSSSPTTSPSPTPSPAPAPASGGSGSSVSIPSGAQSLGSQAYVPSPLTVAVGTTVMWTNNDGISHTTTSNASGWDSGTIQPGGQFSRTFSTSGTFAYHCSIHPGMTGTIVVQ